ncbi:MAG: fibronectin type III domain-containing protein, partial [Bacteroidales bacterium]|nr:fibronectin type III domain-containing protein [Bacteroidales bacterium]
GKPTIGNTPVNLAFDVNNLTHNTEYHVSVFLGYFNENAENAYFYSKPLAAWMTKTKRDGLQGLDATNVTDGKSTISIEPAAGLSTMLVKSDKATAPTGLTGKLEVGSSLGTDGTVITILNTDVTTYELTTDIEPGQGFYLHGYTVKDAESATPTYGAYPYSTTVYRPSESLPLAWGPFTSDQASPATTDLPLLVPGWHHDEASSATSAFKFGRPYITAGYIDALMLYADGQDITASIITPAFIPNARRVKATFMTYCSFQAGNSINLEYRENGGDWKQIERFTEFPEPDESGLRPISAMFNCHSKAIIEIRYTASITAYYTLAVASAEVEAEATDITCFPPTGLTIDTADVTDTQLALHWSDDDNETASYTVAFQATDADSWTLTGTAEKTVKLTGLNPNTAYRMQVQAVCAADDSSAFGNPVVFATYAGIPYTESLGNLYGNPDNPFDYESPEDRGVRTYVGKIGETLTPETAPTYTWAARHSANGMLNQNERAMGIHEDILNAALVLPPVYTQAPTLLSFTLNSFDASEKDESYIPQIVRGATPTEEDCRLYVAVSDNGLFTPEDVILTLTGAELNLIDTVFGLETDKTGAIQIAFFFDNPVAHWEDKFHLEVSNLGLTLVPQEYTLSLNATPVDGGTVTGAGRHKENSAVTITATAHEDDDFVAWMNGSVELSKTASYTFKMPAEDVAYTAVFKSNKPVVEPEEYELTLIASPA